MGSKFNRVALVLALLSPPVLAGDVVTDALQAAYVPYRVALFKTNSKEQADAELAIANARAQFAALAQRFGSKPSAPYDRDPEFVATLKKVDEVLAQGEAQIKARELAAGHQTIEAVRDLLGELRRRNGVVVYSDHMNAYHERMEHLLDSAAATLAQPGGMLALAGQAGVVEHLAQRLRSEAPPSLSGNPEFTALVTAVQAAVNGLTTAIARQDPAAVREAIGKVKGPYSRLFIKFG